MNLRKINNNESVISYLNTQIVSYTKNRNNIGKCEACVVQNMICRIKSLPPSIAGEYLLLRTLGVNGIDQTKQNICY